MTWLPGRTQRPVPGTGGRRLGWAKDPDAYPVLTREDRRWLAFGADRKHRTRAEQAAAWEDLPGVVIVDRQARTKDGRDGWLILPEDAAEAVQKNPVTGEFSRPIL